jgi:hypothetical protein
VLVITHSKRINRRSLTRSATNSARATPGSSHDLAPQDRSSVPFRPESRLDQLRKLRYILSIIMALSTGYPGLRALRELYMYLHGPIDCTICYADGAALPHVDEFQHPRLLSLFKGWAAHHTLLEPCQKHENYAWIGHQWHGIAVGCSQHLATQARKQVTPGVPRRRVVHIKPVATT